MRRLRIGIRWWLGLGFVLISAVTAVAVASVFANRSTDAFRGRAEDFVTGGALVAAQEIGFALALEKSIAPVLRQQSEAHQLGIFLFNDKGHLDSAARSHGVAVERVESLRKAIATALKGDRYIATADRGRAVVVALPVGAGVMVAQGNRPELSAELGIVRSNVVEAAAVALGIGAFVGLVVASLISVRLRRIARAAASIERGDFDAPLRPGFGDEVGDLARTVDRMRERLRASFAKLEFERDRLQRLLERLHEGVVTLDRDLVVQFANGEAARVLGLPELVEGQALPEPWDAFSLRGFAEALFAPGATVAQTRVTPDEDSVCLLIGVPGTADDPAILVVADATEQERREIAEREFVANAAHELRTPLTTILGAVETLQSGAKDEPEQRDRFLNLIEREASRLARLARALLVLARAQTREELPTIESVALLPLLEEIAASVPHREGVELEVSCASDLAALANRDLTEQALRNVVENAAKHTERGSIVLRAERHNGRVQIEIQDTGRGVSPEVRERIFDRFYRGGARDPEGFGLGLAIVRQAVGALGGVVDLRSTPSRGTTVTITLPAAGGGRP